MIRDQGSYVKENREKRQQTLRMSANLVRTPHLCNGHFCKQIYIYLEGLMSSFEIYIRRYMFMGRGVLKLCRYLDSRLFSTLMIEVG